MLKASECVLVVIDVQEKLWPVMSHKEPVLSAQRQLVKSALLLDLPILVTEQIAQKIGTTIPELREVLPAYEPIPKSSFGCCSESLFMERLHELRRRQVLLCGIETHVCVCQTALQLLDSGYEVFIAADAVSSRNSDHIAMALERLRAAGCATGPTEMFLFELLGDARHRAFRNVLKLVK